MIEKKAIEIVKTLKENGHTAVFAGGCVRDRLKEDPTFKDIDIATSATPDEIESIFSRTVPIGKAFGVINVLKGEYSFEVATFRSDGDYLDGRRPSSVVFSSMEEDAKRRDLTVNGLFLDPITGEIFDFVDGENDFKDQIIRFIGDPEERIKEDKLRMLRAIRFMADLNFSIEEESLKAIKKYASQIIQISAERIRDEITKILKCANPLRAFEVLNGIGLLSYILPEVVRLKGCEQNVEWHPEGDVWNHTFILLNILTTKTKDEALLWAGLLHDIGKPDTFKIVDGQIRASGHAKIGADIARIMMTRLKFSNELIDRVDTLIYNHMKIKDVQKMNKSTLRKLMGREDVEDLKLLSFVDCLASSGDNDWHTFLEERQKDFINEDKPILPPCLLNGNDLIELGFKPGPIFSEILNKVMDLQLEEEITTKEEALIIINSYDKRK